MNEKDTRITSKPVKPTSWHIGVAAEAIAAAQFARLGFGVAIQYGANQPEFDLTVTRGDRFLKVSVKGSQDGSWGLTQSLLKQANYHSAIEQWLERHSERTVLCFVQFKDVTLDNLPRVYLARPAEVAARLKESATGRGDTILYENHVWSPRARGNGTVEQIPDEWKFSEMRVISLLAQS